MIKDPKLNALNDYCNKWGEVMFRTTVCHLFDAGCRYSKDPKVVERTCANIMKNTPNNAIMTPEFQCELVRNAAVLANEFEIWDILKYIKKYIPIG